MILENGVGLRESHVVYDRNEYMSRYFIRTSFKIFEAGVLLGCKIGPLQKSDLADEG